MRIAVFVDGSGKLSAPHQAVRVSYYAKENGRWSETKSVPMKPVSMESAETRSAFLRELETLVQDAQAVAGSSITGLAYTALNKPGKHIFEITELSPEQLSGIAGDVAMEDARRKLAAEVFRQAMPVKTEIAGVYSLDLVTALEENPDLSSKMILRPFLQSTPFTELTIICRHVPNWLLQEQALAVSHKQRGEYLIVTVTHRLCGEAMP